MSSTTSTNRSGVWSSGTLPAGVLVGQDTRIDGEFSFKRYHASNVNAGLTIGDHCMMDGVQFAVGSSGSLRVGSYCHFTNAVLLCEQDVRIGDYVLIGWNATIADSDFHPIDPAQRVLDAIACSTLSNGRPRPALTPQPIIIEDDVYIGPAATILKGVRVGRGSWIEAGAVVTRDVPPGSRVMGNPARVVMADSVVDPEMS